MARCLFGSNSSSGYVKPFDPASKLGVQKTMGFWDPLGFTADGHEATFKRRRSVVCKHGKVSMAAAMGYITPEYYKFPLLLVSVAWLSPKLRWVQLTSVLGSLRAPSASLSI